MTVEIQVREAIIQEIGRQADNSDGRLTARMEDDRLFVQGSLDIDDLVMVVMGSVAGGP